MSSPVPARRAFNFQISKPIITGYMQKQGALHKAFKRRFFVLYPGFLVYYDRKDKWQSDVHRDTLGGRLNAIKLKGGRLDRAKHAPKGCNYGITLTSPDPNNKRSEYLFNCQSNEERFQWMQHIQSAIPSSKSNLVVKTTASETPVAAEKPAATEKTKVAEEKPVSPVRQETVDEAAMMAVGGLEDVEDELTDMDEVLGPRSDDAKSSSSGGSSPRSSLSPEEATHYVVAGDCVVSSASVQANSDPSTPADSPVPANKNTQQTDEEVKENGHDTAVAEEREEETHSKQEEKEEAQPKEEEPRLKELEVAEEKKEEVSPKEEEVVHSKEVTVPASQSPELVIKVTTESGSSSKPFSSSDDDSEGEEAPPTTPSDTTSTSTEGDRQPDSANSEPSSPAANGHENGLGASPDLDARRPTGIKSFVEKRGFLYKMGGNFKTWKLRYFVLQPGMFSYYKKDPKEKPLGEVKLKNLQIMFPKPNERTYSSYQFIVHTESQWNRRSDYVMAAKSEKEMKEWIDAFKLASGLKRLSSEAASHRDAATVASSAVKQ